MSMFIEGLLLHSCWRHEINLEDIILNLKSVTKIQNLYPQCLDVIIKNFAVTFDLGSFTRLDKNFYLVRNCPFVVFHLQMGFEQQHPYLFK